MNKLDSLYVSPLLLAATESVCAGEGNSSFVA